MSSLKYFGVPVWAAVPSVKTVYAWDVYTSLSKSAASEVVEKASANLGPGQRIVDFRVPKLGELYLMGVTLGIGRASASDLEEPRFIVEQDVIITFRRVATFDKGEMISVQRGRYLRYLGPDTSKSFYYEDKGSCFVASYAGELYEQE